MNISSPIRVGVVGLGKLGLLHAALTKGLPQSQLVAIADNSSFMLSALQSQIADLKVYDDYKVMLKDGGLDAAIIATPSHLHIPMALDFVKAGVALLIEKPLSISSAQAKPLVEALREKPVPVMVGYMNRHSDLFIKAREIVQSGALGKLQMLRSSMYISQLSKPGKGWRYEKKTAGGGVLITQNSHLLDLLLWIFGDVTEVSGQIQHLYSDDVEDAVHAYMKFKSGLAGWMDCSWSTRHYRLLTMQVHVQGENGTLDFNDDEVRLFLDSSQKNYHGGWSTWRKPDVYEGVPLDIGGPTYTRQALAFYDAVQGKNPISSDILSAYKVQCLMDSIYESASEAGRPVSVSVR